MSTKTDDSRTRWERTPSRATKPSSTALAQGRRLVKKVYGRSTPLRRSFVARSAPTEPVPPMAVLVNSGRAAPVRLKLYLGILCMASAGDVPHAASAPARAWAELLGLPDPSGHGERRVRDAIKYLEARRLIGREMQPGAPSQLILLREDGSGADYTMPASHPEDATTKKLPVEHHFVSVPSGFWSAGWSATLSNNAVATWLALLHATRSGVNAGVWVSPSQVSERYAISEDTWGRGVRELHTHGLLAIVKRPVSEAYGFKRVRNMYTLRMKRIGRRPQWTEDE